MPSISIKSIPKFRIITTIFSNQFFQEKYLSYLHVDIQQMPSWDDASPGPIYHTAR